MPHSRRRCIPTLVCLLLAMLSACAPRAKAVIVRGAGHLWRPTDKPVISSPVAFDWNRDGVLEVAVGSWDGNFYLLDATLRLLPGWPRFSDKGYFSSPALADLDGDGEPEILVGSERGRLHAWHYDGRPAKGFPIDLGYRAWASPSILGDGRIVMPGLDRTDLLSAQGKAAPGWPQPMPNWADATAALGPDLIAVTTLLVGTKTSGALVAWHLDGTPYPWSPLRWAMDSDSSPAIADLDKDGRVEIIAGDDEGLLHVINLDGQELPGFPVRAQSLIEASPAIADLDGDGYLDIAVGSWDGRMYLWNHRGQLLPGWPIQVGDHVISSPALVDLDGDDRLDVVVGSKDKHLYGWSARGQPLPGFPYDLGDFVHSSPWVGDLEGDGRADIVVGANNGIHLLRNVGPLGRAAWPMFHRDARRSGAVP